MYVIRNTDTGRFVAPPGSEFSYTKTLEAARTFPTRAAAEDEVCFDNEVIIPVVDLLRNPS